MRLSQALRCVTLLLLSAPALAAQETGRIVGKVIDQEHGTAIAGAVLEVDGTEIRAQSAIDGRYTLTRVPAGPVRLRARFIGYQPKVIEGVVVPAGGVVEQNLALQVQAIELEEITVAAAEEQGSVNRALDEQRNATNVVSSISAEQIAKSPDSDAGQAVQRVSGVTVQDGKYVFVRGLGERYTTTALNGARLPSPEPERKVVPLDLFPAGLIDGISTSKTFTPEQAGDFSGAAVNITTKEFPARRVLTFSSSVGYNTAATGKDLPKAPTEGREWLGFGGSARRIPSALKAAGNLSGLTQPQVNGLIASFRDVWRANDGNGSPNGSFGASLGGEDPVFGQRIGYLASLTYSYGQEVRSQDYRALAVAGGPINQFAGTTGKSSVLWGGLLNLSTRIGSSSKLSFNNTYTRSADNEASQRVGTLEQFQTLGPLFATRLTFVARSVFSSQLHGEHLLGQRHYVDWTGTVARTTRDEPDRSDLAYQATRDPATGTYRPTAWADLQQSATRTFSDVGETNYNLAGNYRLTLGGAARPAFLKVGGAWRHTDRDADSRAYDLRNLSASSQELAQSPESLFSNANALAGKFLMSSNSNAGRYSASDKVAAGYVQLEVPLTRWAQVVGGARVERWTLDLQDQDPNGVVQPPVRRENTDVLPALALNLSLTETQTLRLSASQTLSRPEYRELSEQGSFDFIGGLVTRGNAGLERALIQNYDARWEWYPNPGEVVSIGVFAKRFDQPIEKVIVGTTGAPTLEFVNAKSAHNYGAELEVRKGLAMISPSLANLTLFANTTLMHSRITPGNDDISSLTSTRRPMVGQAGYVVNSGLGWLSPSGRWSATALYNVVGRRIAEAGVDPLPDTYEEARHLVDVSLQFPVFGTMSGKFDAKNLLDAPYRLVQGDVLRERYKSGRVFALGFTWKP
ncbi:MAG TPA: TonB-dependent receptor [Gemmatimonadales bacterium]|nr:TonB-dependent receptor [Gemmatimonadales bacterium]